ncbi:MAG: hypothetical protein QF570_12155 [Myxococcota bacterium]|nr:hypothetical protein [Myxococcota bacterium]
MQSVPPHAIAEKLVGLSEADWKYADLYLRDAEAAMSTLCTRSQFRGLQDRRTRVERLSADLQRAIRLGDWGKAASLADEGSRLRGSVGRDRHVLALAEKIYGRRSFHATPTVFGFSGTVSQPARVLKREISRIVRDLRSLATVRDSQRGFYQTRADQLDRLIVDLPEESTQRPDPSEFRERALIAAGRADFSEVLRIARTAAEREAEPLGRTRAPRPNSRWIERLADPLPAEAIARASKLGFEPAAVEGINPFNVYLSCRCVDRAVLWPPSRTGQRWMAKTGTCGHTCPPEIGMELKSTFDTLMGHPALTSAGTRYLPWFGTEFVLVEAFPEDEPDTKSPLLDALSLPHRQGLARFTIEDALLSKGAAVCEDLGLDPIEYRITCIPFDIYNRLATRHGWGTERLWTHFDGYHVTRELKLLALVGGDVRHGGPDDLCAVGRAYDSRHITARFAIVRRDRFEAR